MMKLIGGSSPLARGLPENTAHGDYGFGIIPARAGFTGLGGYSRATWWDHPRSRGVYIVDVIITSYFLGSSPLARGLPNDNDVPASPGGIIPARAGFTGMTPASARTEADHPRSRGVYSALTMEQRRLAGSSPLARGLQQTIQTSDRKFGIIPARAGFTH